MNVVVLMGRLVADPVYRVGEKNGKETSFVWYRLAVARDYKDMDGKRPVDFIACKAYGSCARFARDYFRKGDMAAVTGRIVSEPYDGPEGRQYFTGVRVDKSSLARRRSSETDHNREMAPGQDHTGGFVTDEQGEGGMLFDQEETEFPPIPDDYIP